jgi:hypothetical protein
MLKRAFQLLDEHNRKEKKASKSEAKPEVSIPKEAALAHEGYRRLVASMPCIRCGKAKRSQAAHPPPIGKSIKRDDRECFPLCCDGPGGYRGCHPQFDKYELMPHDKAVKQAEKWGAATRAEIIAADEWPTGLPKWSARKPAAKRKARA